jgi:hypothetical protein
MNLAEFFVMSCGNLPDATGFSRNYGKLLLGS